MTVDKLIKKLQQISKKGYGDLPVTTYDEVDEGGGFVAEVGVFTRETDEEEGLYYKSDGPFSFSNIDAHVAIMSDGRIEP